MLDSPKRYVVPADSLALRGCAGNRRGVVKVNSGSAFSHSLIVRFATCNPVSMRLHGQTWLDSLRKTCNPLVLLVLRLVG